MLYCKLQQLLYGTIAFAACSAMARFTLRLFVDGEKLGNPFAYMPSTQHSRQTAHLHTGIPALRPSAHTACRNPLRQLVITHAPLLNTSAFVTPMTPLQQTRILSHGHDPTKSLNCHGLQTPPKPTPSPIVRTTRTLGTQLASAAKECC